MNNYIKLISITIIIIIIFLQLMFYHKKYNNYQINQFTGIDNIRTKMSQKYPTVLRLFNAEPQKLLNQIYDDLGVDRKNESQIIVNNKIIKTLDFYKKFAKYIHLSRPLHFIQNGKAILNSILDNTFYSSISDTFFIMNIGITPITIKLFSPKYNEYFSRIKKGKNLISYQKSISKKNESNIKFIEIIIKPLDIVYIPNYWIYQLNTESCDYCFLHGYSIFTYLYSILTKITY